MIRLITDIILFKFFTLFHLLKNDEEMIYWIVLWYVDGILWWKFGQQTRFWDKLSL